MKLGVYRLLVCALAALIGSKVTAAEGNASVAVAGESLLLAGTTPGRLCFDAVTVTAVRSTYDPAAPGSVAYEPGKDYVLDPAAGTIARTPDSRIPDFATNVLYGQKNFDHSKFPGYGNLKFFVYVDYTTTKGHPLTAPSDQSARFTEMTAKLSDGGPFKILTYGDSISAGGEASTRALCFDERYAAWLRTQYPAAQISVENGATGGDSTVQGMQRLEEKVLTRAPDLVLIGFGMNDHNVGGVSIELFKENLGKMIDQIRARTGATVMLFSAFPPNPDWKHSSHRMEHYAVATQEVADAKGTGYADVFGVWQRALVRKDLPSLLANNINHPNDYGHGLYFEATKAVGIDSSTPTAK